MPDPDPAPQPRRHPPPPPHDSQRWVLTLLLIAPVLDVVAITAASPMLVALAAMVARGAVFLVVVRAFALVAGTATTDRPPADRRAGRGRTPRG